MEKLDSWFQSLNRALDKVGKDVLILREEMADIRASLEQHQNELMQCKLAVDRVDDKIEALRKRRG